MSFEFKRFNSSSFEHFAQALALHYFGAGLQVYGPGPDGARDASFEGTPNYPTAADPWKGYSVIQAKYREDTAEDWRDADWVVKQIKGEEEKFLSKQRNLRRPEHYLLVTNVKLSSVGGENCGTRKGREGGLSKVEGALKDFAEKIGCRSYEVWHRAKLERLLEAAPVEIKRAYAAWTTPSDLIWQILRQYEAPRFAEVLGRAMAHNLRENRNTRLQEAGHSEAEGTSLTQVFVDLPFIETYDADMDLLPFIVQPGTSDGNDGPEEDEEEDEDTSEAGFRAEKLAAAVFRYASDRMNSDHESDNPKGRIVILGGPGQGKSTIGQFIVQYFEANFLLAKSAPGSSAETKALAKSVVQAAGSEGIHRNTAFRVPIRIVLPSYADRCATLRKAGTERFSLIDYAAAHFARQANSDVSSEDIRAWLKQHPWFIVLDGLDEVPPSGERRTILQEIDALFDEIASADGDAVVIVTTRQQGYNKDLNPAFWRHWELLPLDPTNAIHYAKRLALVRLSEEQKRDRVIERLTHAAASQSTKQLMSSPLQVAILFTLVDMKGDVPTDRWSLFERYFSVLRDREEGKGGEFGDMLKRHRTAVELIHHYAGFALQLSAEKSGGADSYLTKDQFEQLVSATLEREEHEGPELRYLTTGLARLATDRLVLLASRVEDRIAFDVRSLQEYMAAAMVTSGADDLVKERLRSIVAKSHWRHTVQIAASRCFADTGKRHLSDFIGTLCAELNSSPSERGDRLARSGSTLAIDLLADGLGLDSPRHRRILFDRALESLELGPGLMDRRLGAVVDKSLVANASETIRRLTAVQSPAGDAAWRLLAELIRNDPRNFYPIGETILPKEPNRLLEVSVNWEGDSRDRPPFLGWIRSAAARAELEAIVKTNRAALFLEKIAPVLSSHPYQPRRQVPLRIDDRPTVVGVSFRRLAQIAERRPLEKLDPKLWEYLFLVEGFYENPNKKTLGDLLVRVGTDYELFKPALQTTTHAWPLQSLLLMMRMSEAQTVVGPAVLSGGYGDIKDWLVAEERWTTVGINIEDIKFAARNRCFFNGAVASVGLPSGSALMPRGRRPGPTLGQLLELADIVKSSTAAAVSWELRRLLGFLAGTSQIDLSVIKDIIRYLLDNDVDTFSRVLINRFSNERRPSDHDELAILEQIGRKLRITDYMVAARSRTNPRGIDEQFAICASYLDAFRQNPTHRGLIPVISMTGWGGVLRSQLEMKDEALFRPDGEDSPTVALSASAIRTILAAKSGQDFVQQFSEVLQIIGSRTTYNFVETLFREVLLGGHKDRNLRIRAADAIFNVIGDQHAADAIEQLRQSLESRFAGFQQADCWDRAGLPDFLRTTLVELEAGKA